ncbi:hypothetical protein F2Q69_00025895 [Brassica cretica]|uniref:RING-type domain-containing protein n=1 Tax=Brassica cretica TaxID=69181 RepID=A0A8S9S7J6_BRACR|nr:hypothetical protein F2Q69_00025895 [Brassica cretica]
MTTKMKGGGGGGEHSSSRSSASRRWTLLLCLGSFCVGMFFTDRQKETRATEESQVKPTKNEGFRRDLLHNFSEPSGCCEETYCSLLKNIASSVRFPLPKEDIALGELYVQAGTLMHKCADIFVLLMRLRQAVDHPYLVVYSQSSGANANLNDENKKEHECGLCHEPAKDSVVTSCAHVFCKACLIDFSASLGKVSCPKCSKLLTMGWTTNADTEQQAESKTTLKGFRASSIMNQINLNDFQTSTKIEALREEIRLMVERDVSAKAILFSQFTSFLELINYTLGKVISLCYVSVIILTFVFKQNETLFCLQHSVGLVASNWWEQCPRAARDVAINKFREDPDCKVFLMSMKAGGVALNLTVASHVFIMEPWWNPAVERQAQDRIHRIGQYKPIREKLYRSEEGSNVKIDQSPLSVPFPHLIPFP